MNHPESNLINTFATNLKRLRLAADLSQEQLASVADLDRTYVSGCERGIRNASIKSVERLAQALNVEPYILFVCVEG